MNHDFQWYQYQLDVLFILAPSTWNLMVSIAFMPFVSMIGDPDTNDNVSINFRLLESILVDMSW